MFIASLLSLTTSVLLTSAHAAEDSYTTLLAQAKGALLAGDFKEARDLLLAAEEAAPGSAAPISQTDVARLSFYRGVLYWRASPESAALEAWKQALTLAPKFAPEADLLPDAQERDAFLALRAEVNARTQVPVKLPEDTGEALIFIDGQRMDPDALVLPGKHLVQVKCASGEVRGTWHAYGAPPRDYLAQCAGGRSSNASSSRASSSSASSSRSSSSSSRSSASTRSAAPRSEEEKASGGSGEAAKNISGIALLTLGVGGGGASVLLYTQAANASDAYDHLSAAAAANPELLPKAESYYDHTLTPRYLRFYGASIGSGVLLGAGTLLVLLDVEGPMVAPLPGGGLFTWSGRF